MTQATVKQLQAQLAGIESGFAPLRQRGVRDGLEWDAIAQSAAQVRKKLFDMTGDWYGKPKVKLSKPSDELLEGVYLSPEDVPLDVRQWVQRNANLLTSDATDAVRWWRISDTLQDDRYPAGEMEIYRAVAGDEIRPGDWVTTSRAYAELHLARHLRGKGFSLSDTVDGQDVLMSPTGNDEEAIFAPRSLSGPICADDDDSSPGEMNQP